MIIAGFIATVFILHVTWYDSLIGVIAGGGVLYIVAVVFFKLTGKEGMGGGDVRLLAMIGAWMGWRPLLFILLISSFSGTIIGGGSLLLTRKELKTTIPYGPFLALGALIYLFFGREFTTWYYGLIY
jgi:leader peptidase (prepilin peptidase)/N-methyltransferase